MLIVAETYTENNYQMQEYQIHQHICYPKDMAEQARCNRVQDWTIGSKYTDIDKAVRDRDHFESQEDRDYVWYIIHEV